MRKNIFHIIGITLFISCKEEQMPDESLHAADDFNRTIKVNTSYIDDTSFVLQNVLPGVQVEIYSSRQNFIDRLYADAIRTTDSAGYCIFENRNKDFYWIIAQHDSLDIITDSVSTPANTISFVELLFY